MVRANTPFLRWKDRFHRGRFAKKSKFRLFLLRPTFDRLKRVSKAKSDEKNPPANEVEILRFIRDIMTSFNEPGEWYVKRGFLTQNKELEITAAYISNLEKRGGLVVFFPESKEFAGELDEEHVPLILDYVDDLPSRWIDSDDLPQSIGLHQIPIIPRYRLHSLPQ